MQVKCGQCNAGYTLPAERLVPGRRVQFACRHCGERIVVQVPNEAAAVEPAVAPVAVSRQAHDPLARPLAEPQVEARPDEPRWFVAAADGSHRKLAESELETEIRRGTVTGETLVWRKGLPEWLPAAQVDRWRPTFTAMIASLDAATVDDPALAAAAIAASPAGQRGRRQTDLAFAAPVAAAGQTASHDQAAALGGVEAETRWGIPAMDDEGDRPDSDAHAMADPAIALSQVAGLSGTDASQAAVSLPVVRAARLDAPAAQRSRDRLAERRMPSAGHRLPAHRSESGARSPESRSAQHASAAHGRGQSNATGAPSAAAHPASASASALPASMSASGVAPAPPRDAAHPGRDGGEAGSDGLWAPATDTYVGPRDGFTRRLGGANERDLLLAHVERERSGQRELRRWQIATLGACCIAIIGLAVAGAAMLHARRTQQALAACTAQIPAAAHRAAAATVSEAAASDPLRTP